MAADIILPDLSHTQQALDQLTSTLQICAGFNHRNKNQHGASKWWAQFDILRRNIRRLHDELQVLIDKETRYKNSSAAKKKQQQGKPPPKELVKASETVEARARWLRAECLSRTYLAFTQLAADNQYAALGLLLLGVLAHVHSALALLLGDEEADSNPPPQVETSAVGTSLAHISAAERPSQPPGSAVAADLGIAIDRGQLGLGTSVQRTEGSKIKPGPEQVKAKTTASDGDSKELASKSKRTLTAADDDESRDKKKKKKRKKGDEFGDLFSSLL